MRKAGASSKVGATGSREVEGHGQGASVHIQLLMPFGTRIWCATCRPNLPALPGHLPMRSRSEPMQRPAAASHSRWPQVRDRNSGSKNSSRNGLNTCFVGGWALGGVR